MTIRLLTDWPYRLPSGAGSVTIPAGSVVSVFDSITETGMIAQKLAVLTAAAVTWTPPSEAKTYDELSPAEVAQVRARLVPGDGNRRATYLSAFNSTLANSDNSAGNAAYTQLIFLPVRFSAVRIGWKHLGGNGALSGLRMIAAATEDYGDLSQTANNPGKTWVTPRRNGTEYNALQWEGWREVTWGGAATASASDAGAENVAVAWSDVIPVEAVPVASDPTGRFAGWYPLLIRVYPGAGFFSRLTYIGFSDPAKYLAECGPQLVLGLNRGSGGDASITSPANWGATAGASVSDANILPLIVEAWSDGQPASIMLTGDSRFGAAPASESGTHAYRNLGFKIEAAARAAGIPLGVLRCAHAGKTTAIYSARSTAILAGQPRPRVSVYLAYSTNDGVPTEKICAEAKARTLAHIERCRDLGITPAVVSIFPTAGGFFSNNGRAQAFDTWCSNLGVPYFSPMQAYGEPSTGDWRAGWAEDTNHMTPAGYTDLAGRVFELVRPYL